MANKNTGEVRPFLKWVGGKQQAMPHISSLYPDKYNRYFEPFVGGGAVFFNLNPQEAHLSDINEELIDCYVVVRDQVEELIMVLEKHKYEKDYYYALRSKDPKKMSLADRVARMIYLNKTGFNGLYRVNKSGKFNVPFGQYKNPVFCNKSVLRACSKRLFGVNINNASFESILDRAVAGDFVYFDPPYIPVSSTSYFTAYQKDGFGMKSQERLLEVFDALSEKGVKVMLSNSDVAWMRDKYSKYNIKPIKINRHISATAANRGPVGELLVTNY